MLVIQQCGVQSVGYIMQCTVCGLYRNAVYSVWVTKQKSVQCVGYTAMLCTVCGLQNNAVYSVWIIQQCCAQCVGYTTMLCKVCRLDSNAV